jgi:hypothetical protein
MVRAVADSTGLRLPLPLLPLRTLTTAAASTELTCSACGDSWSIQEAAKRSPWAPSRRESARLPAPPVDEDALDDAWTIWIEHNPELDSDG